MLTKPERDLLVYAMRLADWCAGQGICPLPEHFVHGDPDVRLSEACDATGFDDWNDMMDAIEGKLRALTERPPYKPGMTPDMDAL